MPWLFPLVCASFAKIVSHRPPSRRCSRPATRADSASRRRMNATASRTRGAASGRLSFSSRCSASVEVSKHPTQRFRAAVHQTRRQQLRRLASATARLITPREVRTSTISYCSGDSSRCRLAKAAERNHSRSCARRAGRQSKDDGVWLLSESGLGCGVVTGHRDNASAGRDRQ